MPANEPTIDAYIRDLPLLARLPDDDLKALASRGRVRRFNAGTTIFHEGDPGDAIYVVVDGRIRMSRISGSGTEATLALIGAGDCTGELSCSMASRVGHRDGDAGDAERSSSRARIS